MNNFLEKLWRSPIKSVLLMQEGFRHWELMADEIFEKPNCLVKVSNIALSKFRDLYHATKKYAGCSEVIADGWKQPPDTWLFNHRWSDGGNCPKTKKPLIREKINGRTFAGRLRGKPIIRRYCFIRMDCYC